MGCGLFQKGGPEQDECGINIVQGANWLKEFCAPNVVKVGTAAFSRCKSLVKVDMPSAEEFMSVVFPGCVSLVSINIPNAKYFWNENFCGNISLERIELPSLVALGGNNFWGCVNLKEIVIGENFQGFTDVYFSESEFGDSLFEVTFYCLTPVPTDSIILYISEYVLPKADTIFNTWQETKGYPSYDYRWKKIEIISDIKEDTNIISPPYLGNNSYLIECIDSAELFDVLGRSIMYIEEGQEILDMNQFATGLYFLKYKQENKNLTSKLIRY